MAQSMHMSMSRLIAAQCLYPYLSLLSLKLFHSSHMATAPLAVMCPHVECVHPHAPAYQGAWLQIMHTAVSVAAWMAVLWKRAASHASL